MASKAVSVDVRLAIGVARSVDPGVVVKVLAQDLGVSRTTFYLYQRRYVEEGLAGLVPRSRAPHAHPNRASLEVEEAVVAKREELAKEGWDCGARSVWSRMMRAGQAPPSARTIHRIFVRRGLVTAQPQKRPRSSYRRFQARQPNGCWQIDGMDWVLAAGIPVKVIRVIDDCSRKTFRCRVADSESADQAWACLSEAIIEHGAPAMLLSDNSLAFNGTRRKVEVAMQHRLRELGVAQVASSAGHPQTCGKNEREHQTMQRWLRAHPPATTKAELQALLDVYDQGYNQDRPHQALGGLTTPEERYAAITKAFPADHPLPDRPTRINEVVVTRTGEVAAGANISVHIGREWEGTPVTVTRQGNQVAVFHHGKLIYSTAIDPTRRYQPSGRKPGRPPGGQARPRVTPAAIATPATARRSQDGAPAAPARTNDLDADEPLRTLQTAGVTSAMS